MNLNTDALFSAVKRKNIQNLLEIVFAEAGYDEAAQIAKETTRMTDAAITRMRAVLPVETETEETPEETEEEEEEVVETPEDAPLTVGDIKLLIADGSKKSLKAAKKALKTQFDKEHPNHSELKKLLKQAKEA